jgi:hypothetical protein
MTRENLEKGKSLINDIDGLESEIIRLEKCVALCLKNEPSKIRYLKNSELENYFYISNKDLHSFFLYKISQLKKEKLSLKKEFELIGEAPNDSSCKNVMNYHLVAKRIYELVKRNSSDEIFVKKIKKCLYAISSENIEGILFDAIKLHIQQFPKDKLEDWEIDVVKIFENKI